MNYKNVKILFCLLIFSLITGCASNAQKTTETDNISQQKTVLETKVEGNLKKNIKDFKFLKIGISRKEILKKLGEPAQDIGFGVYIYVYELKDGANVNLCFNPDDSLNKAVLIDKNKNISKILLGD